MEGEWNREPLLVKVESATGTTVMGMSSCCSFPGLKMVREEDVTSREFSRVTVYLLKLG